MEVTELFHISKAHLFLQSMIRVDHTLPYFHIVYRKDQGLLPVLSPFVSAALGHPDAPPEESVDSKPGNHNLVQQQLVDPVGHTRQRK